MGKFLEKEKLNQAEFKFSSKCFSGGARSDGIYRNKLRPFCLPLTHAGENLFKEIRGDAIEFFNLKEIKWHDGQNDNPSNHLCSSQVCCVNFLFPFAHNPLALTYLLRSLFPDIQKVLPIEGEIFVSFEWIGAKNYLKEGKAHTRKRTRGANFTSADAAVMFERKDGKRQIVLIEWKYTESYAPVSLKIAKSDRNRLEIYSHLYNPDDCPINKDLVPSFEALFYEPFYQLMRQQFLAHEMERMRELGADIVSVLHIAPDHNFDFRKITSPELRHLGETAIDIWKKVVQPPDRFMSVSTEQLFGNFSVNDFPGMLPWLEYITNRYIWVTQLA
jgi:hypothetical protein